MPMISGPGWKVLVEALTGLCGFRMSNQAKAENENARYATIGCMRLMRRKSAKWYGYKRVVVIPYKNLLTVEKPG